LKLRASPEISAKRRNARPRFVGDLLTVRKNTR
jgi:hypothetical protein